MAKVIIIMGSKGDLEHCKKITGVLEKFGIEYKLRIASAHKVPLKVIEIIKEYEKEDVVFITVAGRSNALSGFVDAQTTKPVIACPPSSDACLCTDIFSSLRMPSGVCPLVILEPVNAALAAIKILALTDRRLEAMIRDYQQEKREEIEKADKEVNRNG
ncbi:MAG: 5-(carboxyamino)imidazole ribonucleotide mutase [bacterium]